MKKSRAGFAENEKQNTGLPERRKSARLNGGLFYFEDFLEIENVFPQIHFTLARLLPKVRIICGSG